MFTVKRALAAVATLSLLIVPIPASADTTDAQVTAKIHLTGSGSSATSWMIRARGKSEFEGGNSSQSQSARANVRNDAQNKQLNVTDEYSTVWNGLAVSGSYDQVRELAKSSDVTDIWPVAMFAAPDDKAAQPVNKSALGMIHAEAATKAGFTGKDMKVGVIDSGIEIDHPDFGGTGTKGQTSFPSAKIAGGYDFVGDDYDGANNPPKPGGTPHDCLGHGTHVAGIIAGNGKVKGVAPDATLYSYRIFSCKGVGAPENLIVSAIERAGKDGMDVVNMSIGIPLQSWASGPVSAAIDALTLHGSIVVISAGNEGEKGLFTPSNPGVTPSAISVASIENANMQFMAMGVAGQSLLYVPAVSGPPMPKKIVDAVLAGPDASIVDGKEPVAGCPGGAAYTNDPRGKFVVVKTPKVDGQAKCTFAEQAQRAAEAGAIGMVQYNTEKNPDDGVSEGSVTIPALAVGSVGGTALTAAASTGETQLDFTAIYDYPQASGGRPSEFSSRGLSADLGFTPSLAAPGGMIYSTLPLDQGAYGTKSGTSMAAPHVTGTIAVLLQARPDLKGRWMRVREALQNTASPVYSGASNDSKDLAGVFVQGAGMIDVASLLKYDGVITPGQIPMTDNAQRTVNITLKNSGSKPVTYKISSEIGETSSGSSSVPHMSMTGATVDAPDAVTVPARGQQSVRVTIKAPSAAKGSLYGGWVTFTSDTTVRRVPYVGMIGKLKDLPALTDLGAQKLPALMAEQEPVETGKKPEFYLSGSKRPQIGYHLAYPVSDIVIEVYRAKADGKRGEPLGIVEQTVNAGRTGVDYFTWNGQASMTYRDGKKKETQAKVGESFILTIRALRAKASPSDEKSWDRWESSAFTYVGEKTP